MMMAVVMNLKTEENRASLYTVPLRIIALPIQDNDICHCKLNQRSPVKAETAQDVDRCSFVYLAHLHGQEFGVDGALASVQEKTESHRERDPFA